MADQQEDFEPRKYIVEWLDGSERKCRTQKEIYTRINRRANACVATSQTVQTALSKPTYSPQFNRCLVAMGVKSIRRVDTENE